MKKSIFISSTAYNLVDLRAELAKYLYGIGYNVIYNESASFPKRKGIHAHDVCLEAVKECDIFLLIIDSRYGETYKGVLYDNEDICITWYEYKIALEYDKEIHTFVREKVFNERKTFKDNKDLNDFKPAHVDNIRVFDFIDWIARRQKDNWLDTFIDSVQLKNRLIERLNEKSLHAALNLKPLNSLLNGLSRDLYVDRGSKNIFLSFIKNTNKMIFPVFGRAGIGKTCEMGKFIDYLPEKYFPLIVKARLATSLIDAIEIQIKRTFKDEALFLKQGDVLTSLASLIPSDWSIVIFLDGINEYHFSINSKYSIKSELFELFAKLETLRIKTIVSCRTFTWDNVLSDESLLRYMYITKETKTYESYLQYNNETQSMQLAKKEIVQKYYGYHLSIFTDIQREMYWSGLLNKYNVEIKSAVVNNFDDPLLCSIVAEEAIAGVCISSDYEIIMEQYVRRKCRDKGSKIDEEKRYQILTDLVRNCIDNYDIKTIFTFDEVLTVMNIEQYEYFLNSGLLTKDIKGPQGTEATFFKFDRILEYFIYVYIYQNHIKQFRNIQDKAVYALNLLLEGTSSNQHSDYYHNIVILIFNRLAKQHSKIRKHIISELSSNLNVLNCVLHFLSESSIPNKAYMSLMRWLGHPIYGYGIACLLKEKPNLSILKKHIGHINLNTASNELLINTISILPYGNTSISVPFLVSIAESSNSNIRVQISLAYALGEIKDLSTAYILINWLDKSSKRNLSLDNACLWSLGVMRVTLDPSILKNLLKYEGLEWSVARYIFELGGNQTNFKEIITTGGKKFMLCLNLFKNKHNLS